MVLTALIKICIRSQEALVILLVAFNSNSKTSHILVLLVNMVKDQLSQVHQVVVKSLLGLPEDTPHLEELQVGMPIMVELQVGVPIMVELQVDM